MIARIARSGVLARVLLVALCLVLYLPGFLTIPAVDQDEARFVQTTRQMLETGNLIDPRLHDEPRYNKPIGIYWLQYAVAEVSGLGASAPVWVYRIVSLLAAIGAVQLTFSAGRRFLSPEAGLIGAGLLGAALILNSEAHLAKTDAMVLCTVVAAQYALWALYAKGPRQAGEARERFFGWPLLFWVALGVGTLIKGPITPMVAGLTALMLVAWDRKAGWLLRLRPISGVAVLGLIVLPWLVAIGVMSHGKFFEASLGQDMLAKVGEGQESHGAPPGMHLAMLALTLWPGALLIPAAIPEAWRRKRDASIRFLVAWAIPTFVVFELVATKLPHYTLPTFPAIALLVAAAVVAVPGLEPRWWVRLLAAASALIGVLLAVAANVLFNQSEGTWSAWGIGLTVAGALVALVVIFAALRGTIRAALGLLIVEAAFVYAAGFGAVVPAMTNMWPSPRLAATAERVAGCPNPEVITAGYYEASIVFAVGTDIKFGDGAQAADFLAGDGCRVAIVTDDLMPAFSAELTAKGITAGESQTLSGLDLGTAKQTTFHVIGAAHG